MTDDGLRHTRREIAITAVMGLTGHRPYAWQQRLLFDHLINGQIPDAVDVPTGLGKTRVMALWLVARAMGAPLPRRLIYVVDRRAVVDQASEEARRLSARLPDVLNSLADDESTRWREQLGLSGEGIPVSTLRGQLADNRRWLESAGCAAIIVATVDMIGSRLLFEGYGASSGMRPVHAALVATDALVVIDEAHLVAPFVALLKSAQAMPRLAPVPALRVLSLSATGAKTETDTVFRLDAEDHRDPPVRARLNAAKRLRVREVDDLTKELTDRAFELGAGGKRVLVFCNSRDRQARQVEKLLRERCAKEWPGVPTTALLVGARRVLERERLAGRPGTNGGWLIEPDPVFRRFMADAAPQPDERPAFLIATSAGEVGVDIDADHMVCDLVAWERMVQRLGRVNRSGRPEPAIVDVLWSRAVAKALRDDIEDSVEDQLAILRAPFEQTAWTAGEDGRLDASPSRLMALKAQPDFAVVADAATTETPLRPALTPPLLDAWAMTSLKDHPGRPRIEPWIRGWVESEPQSRLVWRRVLPTRPGAPPDMTLLGNFFSELPPHLTEVLEFDARLVAAVLKARATKLRAEPQEDGGRLAAAILGPGGDLQDTLTLGQLADQDGRRLADQIRRRTIIIDARLGGLSEQGLIDADSDAEPPTLDGDPTDTGSRNGWSESLLVALGRRLRLVTIGTEALDGWVRQAGWPLTTDEDAGEPRLEWRVERRADAPESGDAARTTRAQGLAEHHEWTGAEAARLASALHLPAPYANMLEIAGRAHDAGKDRDLWQTAMGADRQGRPYAKTTGRRAVPALLQGYRHEFGSLKDASDLFDTIEDPDLRDLGRHLVAAHHGHARPVIKPFDPLEPPSASAERARETALRFARLQLRWGPWGLAWWELLLRSADWAASAQIAGESGN